MKDQFEISESVKKGMDFLSQPTPTVEVRTITDAIVNEIKEAIAPTEKPQKPPTPIIEDIVDEPQTEEEIDDNVESFIWLIDFAQDIILSWFAKRKLKSKAVEIAGEQGMEILKEKMLRIKKEGITTFTPVEAKLKDLKDAVDEFLEDLPMEEKEKQRLQLPLRQLLKEKNIKVSPMQKFWLSIGMQAASRILVLRSL